MAEKYPGQFFPMLGKFSELPQLLNAQGISQVDGILIDAGCSSMQFDNPNRGFALSSDGPLDMRMDGYRFPDSPTAADVIEHMEEEHLAKILKVYGEEKQAKRIARALTEAKYMFKRLKTTSELASLVATVLNDEIRLDKLARPSHAATKTFQALRIFVNNELNELNRGIELAHEFLKPKGALVTLTFHSLEDRIIKRHFVGIEMDEPVTQKLSQKYQNAAKTHNMDEIDKIFSKKWIVDNKHVLVPSSSEIEQNPRSRSAKLRCAHKNDKIE
jgi:receptor-type tyrosine-protein phosphatase gamma